MKFLCSHCKAKYQIADERVAGRTLRMTCRQCRQEIVIRGEFTPVPHQSPLAAPPSALGSGFASHLAASPPTAPPPAIDQWHVAINDIPVGPMRRDEVARKVQLGAVNGDSLAWREGLDDWLPMRHIPELAVLLGPPAPPPSVGLPPPPSAASMVGGPQYAPPQPPPPPQPVTPAQRQHAAPLGGRAGAGAYGVEDWQPPAPIESSSISQVAPMPEPPVSPAAGPSVYKMFAAMGAFAFLMAAMTIVGAGWLSGDKQASAPATAPETPSAPAPAPADEEEAANEEEPSEDKVVELDLQEIDGADQQAKPTAKSTGSSSSKKKLTAEQEAMLARMGGGLDEGPAKIRAAGSRDSRSGGGRGGLTAAQLSKVVLKGRKNLQRCYETALRGSGSEDTVRMDVEITVSASGNVTRVNAKGKALPGMDTCIERTVKMWRFPNSGETTQTKFPVVFQPGA